MRVLVVLLVAMAAVVLATVLGIAGYRDARHDAAAAEAQVAATRSASELARRVDDMTQQVEDAALAVAARGEIGSSGTGTPGLPLVVFVPDDPRPATVSDLLRVGVDVVAQRAALDRARDTGEVVLGPPAGDPPIPVLVRALYEDEGVVATVPSDPSTATRREQLAGHIVGVVDPGALVDALGDRDWSLTDGSVRLAGSGDVGAVPAQAAVAVLERQWVVSASVDRSLALGALGWTRLALGLAALAAILVAGRMAARSIRAQSTRAEASRGRARSIARLSTVVQRSQDLGEILPALSVELSDRLGLAGISLAVRMPDGSSREVFTHGERPDLDAVPARLGFPAAEAGVTVARSLQRAERVIAVLRVLPGRRLDADDLELLELAAEMITAAVVTSRSLEQQQEAVARLQALDELKTAFLGTASHELRTPVTAISGFAHVLADRWDTLDDDERRVFADRIASNARSLDTLVQDLLDFARLERGDHVMSIEPLELDDVVRQVLDRLEPVWSTHRIEARLEPAPVLGDRAAIERVVTNLVSNAVKFSPEGAEVRVSVSAGDPTTLVVDDEGPGVAVGEREKIFARFYRGENESVVRTRGVGIGLSVVDDYVRRMSGTVSVTDGPAGGARFVVALPPLSTSGTSEEVHDAAAT